MAAPSPPSDRRTTWTDRAIEYAETYGWKLVPLQANSKSSPQYSDDAVERQLNSFIPVDYDADATRDPDELEALGVQFPVALIGAVTGPESDLLAVEISHREIDPALRDRIDELAEQAPRVLGTHREYVLFRYPDPPRPLPPLTERNGAVLHGDGSVVQLPWRYYRWSLDDRDTVHPPPDDLIGLFHGSTVAENDRSERARVQRGPTESEGPGSTQAPPASASAQDGATDEPEGPFRTGDRLKLRGTDRESAGGLPWIAAGSCTVVTPVTPTVAASSWLRHLAIHVAAGEPFLDYETEPAPVVLLTGTSPDSFRRWLADIDFVDGETLSRLHVVHPDDVRQLEWEETLQTAYDEAEEQGARLVGVDNLSRFFALKEGDKSQMWRALVKRLTEESPASAAVAVAANHADVGNRSREGSTGNIDSLRAAADIIVCYDDASTLHQPGLRHLRTLGGLPRDASDLYCALRNARFERVEPTAITEDTPSRGDH